LLVHLCVILSFGPHHEILAVLSQTEVLVKDGGLLVGGQRELSFFFFKHPGHAQVLNSAHVQLQVDSHGRFFVLSESGPQSFPEFSVKEVSANN